MDVVLGRIYQSLQTKELYVVTRVDQEHVEYSPVCEETGVVIDVACSCPRMDFEREMEPLIQQSLVQSDNPVGG